MRGSSAGRGQRAQDAPIRFCRAIDTFGGQAVELFHEAALETERIEIERVEVIYFDDVAFSRPAINRN